MSKNYFNPIKFDSALFSPLIASTSARWVMRAVLVAILLAHPASGVVINRQDQLLFQANLGRIRAGNSSVPEVFVGSTPCDDLPRQFLGIPAHSPCERITWQLTLLTDQDTFLPTIYKLVSTYGMQAQSAPGFVAGGTTTEMQGIWAIVKGTKSNPEAVVYKLHAQEPRSPLFIVKVGDHLLHLLNPDKSLMLGNPAWSYSLNSKGREN